VSIADDSVAIWRTAGGERFENYRAIFTILDAPVASRSWIDAILAGNPESGAPAPWLKWRQTGLYTPLKARLGKIRSRESSRRSPTAAPSSRLRAVTRISADPTTEIPQVSGGSTGGDRS